MDNDIEFSSVGFLAEQSILTRLWAINRTRTQCNHYNFRLSRRLITKLVHSAVKLIFCRLSCLVPRLRYFTAVNPLGSRGLRFVWATSPKLIDREGLVQNLTRTRQSFIIIQEFEIALIFANQKFKQNYVRPI